MVNTSCIDIRLPDAKEEKITKHMTVLMKGSLKKGRR